MPTLSDSLAKLKSLITPATSLENSTGQIPLENSGDTFTALTAPCTVEIPAPSLASLLESRDIELFENEYILLETLFNLALAHHKDKGHHPLATQETFHTSGELLSIACGFSNKTLYKHLKTLKLFGLIDYKGQKCKVYNSRNTRMNGTLITVALRPTNNPIKTPYDAFKHTYRDLERDIIDGNTAYAFVNNLMELESIQQQKEGAYKYLLDWALKKPATQPKNPLYDTHPQKSATFKETVYALKSLAYTHSNYLQQDIHSFALALCQGLRDSVNNIDFYHKLLWQSVKKDIAGYSTLDKLTNELIHIMAAIPEWAGLDKPAALFITRLKSSGLWNEITC